MSRRKWLEARQLQPEVMDDPALDAREHERALQALHRINLLSASASIVWPSILKLARQQTTTRLRVLDIATGSGDVPLAIARKAKRAGIKLDLLGVDISERAVTLARERLAASELRSQSIHFQRLDALHEQLPGDYDVVMCSLFLHHLTGDEARRLIHSMAVAARQRVLLSDLRRSRYGWLLAYGASRLLTRSKVVHVDALLSVQAAFTPDELRDLARAAPFQDLQIVHRWPCRMLLVGQAPRA
jgi:2-polyprenyl-3-methyl-5-hydroxy-6-metoxy-1,4-benzoquinol methylase